MIWDDIIMNGNDMIIIIIIIIMVKGGKWRGVKISKDILVIKLFYSFDHHVEVSSNNNIISLFILLARGCITCKTLLDKNN